MIQLWTDGSTHLNIKCGYAFIFVHKDEILYKQCGKLTSGPYTSPHAELVAVIEGLRKYINSELYGSDLTIYSDSEFVVKTINEWGKKRSLKQWQSKEYFDLLYPLYSWFQEHKNVKIQHVRAHVGIKYNEIVDKLAKLGCS